MGDENNMTGQAMDSSMSWTIVVHGGAGAMRSMGAEKEAEYRSGLADSVRAGVSVLKAGGHAMAAAIEAVSSMERSGAFNAGRGSCLNLDGDIEADAAVMCGDDLSYGAIAAVPGCSNGIHLAEAIRTQSVHCLFAGPAALRLATSLDGYDLESAEPTAARKAAFAKLRRRDSEVQSTEDLTDLGGTHDEGDTVGAVVLDGQGRLASAVSTGGIWLKVPGRVGDSPLAGAGLWAENGVVACAATGTGEFIMRANLAGDVRARCQLGLSADEAGHAAIDALRSKFGPGRAGLIAVDSTGSISTAFDTAGMGRAWMSAMDDSPTVRVWPEDDRDAT